MKERKLGDLSFILHVKYLAASLQKPIKECSVAVVRPMASDLSIFMVWSNILFECNQSSRSVQKVRVFSQDHKRSISVPGSLKQKEHKFDSLMPILYNKEFDSYFSVQ